MEIIIGKNAGFCYGVERAVNGAKKVLEENREGKVYALGEIVHNKEVVNELEKQGLKCVEDIKEAEKQVVLRAHGVSKQVYEQAEKQGLNIKDFTCKKVLKIHEIVREYAKDGYYIILTGTKNHPENIGTISYCGENSNIIETVDSVAEVIEDIKNKKSNRVLLIAQTTFSMAKFKEIESIIKQEISKLNIEIVIKNTICAATAIRQKEVEELSKIVDNMIIIGGKNSSNTKKLYNISKENAKTYLIETFKELNKEEFQNVKKVGIMAGASTPKKSILEVKEFLEKI